jgi:uncharacterized protein YycO
MIRSADLFFTTSSSIVSKLIRFRTWGKYSHVQIIVDVTPKLTVISADEEGVTYRDVRESEFETYSILTCHSLTEGQRHDILDFCFQQIGKGYDFLGLADFLLNADLQDEDRFFCSELAFLAYDKKGLPLLKRIDHAFVNPMDLYMSPILDEIETKEK